MSVCPPGPPESMREHVVAASKAMKMGDWRTCHSFIINEKMNSKVWDLFPETQRVREMLVRLVHVTRVPYKHQCHQVASLYRI